MVSTTYRLAADGEDGPLRELILRLNADPAVDGVLVQLPLPAPLDPNLAISALDPRKDVDGLTVLNAGRLAVGRPGLVPCTPLGCLRLIREIAPDLAGRRAVIVGRSNLMGKPMAQLLLQSDCTVTLAHSKTRDLRATCRDAEVLVVAAGRPEFIRGEDIAKGAIVIDVGINRVGALDPEARAQGKTRLVGDVAFSEALAVAGAITPVPGGVGPMTIACLLENTLLAAQRRAGRRGAED
jgi:methylenetetrahydrofolate dehydrogenase (NADP+)/methenyltetrahydrofolate cyclohydrolase